MQKRHMLLLNATLALCVLGLGWLLARNWKVGNERYAQFSEFKGEPGMTLVSTDPFLRTSTSGNDIVAKNIFTPDRNNQTTPEISSQEPTQPPVVIGTMMLGKEYEALMAEAEEARSRRFRRVKIGEQLGRFTVVEIRDEAVVIEHQGQRTVLDVYRSAKSVAPARLRPMSAPEAIAPVVQTTENQDKTPTVPIRSTNTPVTSPVGGVSVESDPNLRVKVEGNRRRFERTTPFGPQVWYEEIQR